MYQHDYTPQHNTINNIGHIVLLTILNKESTHSKAVMDLKKSIKALIQHF